MGVRQLFWGISRKLLILINNTVHASLEIYHYIKYGIPNMGNIGGRPTSLSFCFKMKPDISFKPPKIGGPFFATFLAKNCKNGAKNFGSPK